MRCKRCYSDKVVKNGKVRGVQRYRCKKCHYNFTEEDRRTSRETALIKAIYTVFNALNHYGGVQYGSMAWLFGKDNNQFLRWAQNDINNYVLDYHTNSCGAECILHENLEEYFSKVKNEFDENRSIFCSDGKIFDGKYTVHLMIQRNRPHIYNK